jgi:ribonuclease BN (tRNA processing enzyme)
VRLDGGIEVAHVLHNSHPRLGVLIFRVRQGGRSVVYATDIESPDGFDPGISAFIAGADVLVHDSQYFEGDYYSATDPRAGFGHSTVGMAARNAGQCGVKRLFLFHFDPNYSDPMLNEMLAQAREKFPGTDLAQEGKKIKIRR